MDTRVGIGYDVHRLVEGRKLVLGGVEIPFALGLLGHSDADVLTHAVCDALLGATALGDIGTHFPDTDSRFSGISSFNLLTEVIRLTGELGFVTSNVDAVVLAQRPKLAQHLSAMRLRLAEALGISPDRVSVKAKTGEGLDAVGRGEAIAAHAVVLVTKSD
jgi:2-C-methyl-D-erythritol 2,4-cyclodiphosphate synthase